MVGLIGLVLLVVGCGAPDAIPTEDPATATPRGITIDYVRRTIVPDAEPAEEAPAETPEGMTSADVQRIKVLDAKTLLDNGQAVLYDPRSESSYLEEHAAGALSFPEARAADRVGELPTDTALIFYCT